MGNRSKFVAMTAAVSGAALVARRRARSRRAATQVGDGHAPGHAHLPEVPDEPAPESPLDRPWTKNLHGMRHPFSGD